MLQNTVLKVKKKCAHYHKSESSSLTTRNKLDSYLLSFITEVITGDHE